MNRVDAQRILNRLPGLSALVVGDICLDRWCTYEPSATEPSRETGIPRIGVVSTQVTPGAGGTVACNLAALGVGRVAVLGAAGDDGFGWELARALECRDISSSLLVRDPALSTFTYTKLINAQTGQEDLPRVDHINLKPLAPHLEERLLRTLESQLGAFDVILVSDQAETTTGGIVTAAVRSLLERIALHHRERVIWVDSRLRCDLFRRVIIKPNREEADAACLRLFREVDYARLRAYVGAPAMMVTQGPGGVVVVDDNGVTPVTTKRIDAPVDICGAGDSFSAGAAMALRVTGSPVQAARFGNLVASITIMKKGTGTASPAEVLDSAV
jgi:rfaE bifunctional protein kinase chain/domain